MSRDTAPIYNIISRLDFSIEKPHVCEWCGCDRTENLRFSYRYNEYEDPPIRMILYCISCRAREADGQLDSWGKPLRKKPQPYRFEA
jgi:hypothetical protein